MNLENNFATIKSFYIEQIKAFYSSSSVNKELIIKRRCYKCKGKGLYNYYDPMLDSNGYYECDDSPEPERVDCYRCKNGQIILNFKSLEELKAWVETKIKCQD